MAKRCFHTRLAIRSLLVIAVMAAMLGLRVENCLSQNDQQQPAPTKKQFQRPFLIELHGAIDPYLHSMLNRKLAQAKKSGADLIVLEVDSPGGTVDDSLAIGETLSEINWAETVSFIPDAALSGAALLSLGCDQIVMAPSARIGDAGVIFLDQDFMFRYAPEKLRSEVVARSRILAEKTGRSGDLVEAMIDMDVLVFQKKNEQDNPLEFTKRRVEQMERVPDGPNDPLAKPDMKFWELVPESQEKQFLVVSGARGAALGLTDDVANDRAELKTLLLNGERDFTVLKKNYTDQCVFVLNHPIVTFLLLAIGIIALVLELSAPGIGIGAVVSTACFGVFFWSAMLGGTAGSLELVLFFIGVVCILLEIFVIPGFGVPGIFGIFLVIASLFMAGQNVIIPQTKGEFWDVMAGLLSVLGAFLGAAVGLGILSKHMGSFPILNRLMLEPPTPDDATSTLSPDADGLIAKPENFPAIGDWGIAESVLRPAGTVRFSNGVFDVVGDTYIDPETEVRVISIEGNKIVVSTEE